MVFCMCGHRLSQVLARHRWSVYSFWFRCCFLQYRNFFSSFILIVEAFLWDRYAAGDELGILIQYLHILVWYLIVNTFDWSRYSEYIFAIFSSSYNWLYMSRSGQLHDVAALSPAMALPCPIGCVNPWTRWMLWWLLSTPAVNETDSPFRPSLRLVNYSLLYGAEM